MKRLKGQVNGVGTWGVSGVSVKLHFLTWWWFLRVAI